MNPNIALNNYGPALAGIFYLFVFALVTSTTPTLAQQGGAEGGIGGGFGHTRINLEPVGQTVIISEVLTNFGTGDRSKIPFLGSLPYIQRLFRNVDVPIEKRNLTVFLRPRIVRSVDSE